MVYSSAHVYPMECTKKKKFQTLSVHRHGPTGKLQTGMQFNLHCIRTDFHFLTIALCCTGGVAVSISQEGVSSIFGGGLSHITKLYIPSYSTTIHLPFYTTVNPN